MQDTVIAGLVLACVSALAFIAYRHPTEYRTVFNVLSSVNSGIYLIVLIWNTSADVLASKMSLALYKAGLIDGEKISQVDDQVKKVLSNHQIFGGDPFLIFIAIFLYLGLLRILPIIGIVEHTKKSQR